MDAASQGGAGGATVRTPNDSGATPSSGDLDSLLAHVKASRERLAQSSREINIAELRRPGHRTGTGDNLPQLATPEERVADQPAAPTPAAAADADDPPPPPRRTTTRQARSRRPLPLDPGVDTGFAALPTRTRRAKHAGAPQQEGRVGLATSSSSVPIVAQYELLVESPVSADLCRCTVHADSMDGLLDQLAQELRLNRTRGTLHLFGRASGERAMLTELGHLSTTRTNRVEVALTREFTLLVTSVGGRLFSGKRNLRVSASTREQLAATIAEQVGVNEKLRIFFLDPQYATRQLLTDASFFEAMPSDARLEVEALVSSAKGVLITCMYFFVHL
jgi:hypothetical protein